jgi:hypothetical protein
MDWKQAIKRWRTLPPEEQARSRRNRIPLNVAESMAFEGEPVELAKLEAELVRLDAQSATSRRVSVS